MPIPIVSIPKQGPIATRPRRESIYDTEGWDSAGAIDSKITIFRNSTSFSNTTVALTKQKGRDHNLDGLGGQLPKGQMFHWYGVCNKLRVLNGNLFGAAAAVWFDVARRIRESTWWTFYFGTSNAYISVQTWQIPQGADIIGAFTTHTAVTMIGQGQDADRNNNYDVTLNGVPTEIGELESFSVDIEASGVTPTPTLDTFDTVVLKGILFKGIQG